MLLALAVAGLVFSACTSEEATVIDLDAVTTSTADDAGSASLLPPIADEVDPDDPNAEARQQVIDAARQQCLDDPELAEGVVRLIIEATGELANEYRVDCDEIRAEEEG